MGRPAIENEGHSARAMIRLRRAVEPVHRKTEELLDLMSESLTLPRYAATLAAMASVYGPLEEAISRVDGEAPTDLLGIDWASRRKYPLLVGDLKELDVQPRPAIDPPAIASVASAIGAAYVVEGANLGARVIAPHLRRVFGSSVPCRFFGAGESQERSRWIEFRRVAERTLSTTAAITEAEQTAISVFESIHDACADGPLAGV